MTDDLDFCAREPIRIPGSIQPHGCILVVDPDDGRVLQASANAASFLGIPSEDWPAAVAALLAEDDMAEGHRPWTVAGQAFQVAVHRTAQGAIVEFEEAGGGPALSLDALHPRLRRFIDRIDPMVEIAEIAAATAVEVRALTGFNRVLVYRFDDDLHGTVVAEDGDGVLPSYLDLRFPASDIPAQARQLYLTNRLRIIPDAGYQPVPIEPAASPLDGAPLDLGACGLRSVSPVHLEYMRNMGTGASMSLSLVVDGRLWGLVSCHHADPRRIAPPIRAACDFLGRIVSHQIGARERSRMATRRIALKRIESGLLVELARAPSLPGGLFANAADWMRLTGAAGAAVLFEGEVVAAGQAPPADTIRRLAAWIRQEGRGPVFVTDQSGHDLVEMEPHAGTAAGIVAVSISGIHDDAMFWFRPEVVRTVQWAGDRRKAEPGSDGRIHPRHSFDQWRELLRGRALPWSEAEIESARDVRNAIVDFVLRRAEERAALTEELQRTNKELESFSYSVSHDLRAPFRHIVGYAELLRQKEAGLDEKSRHYIGSIVDSALSAGRLVDDLLRFSHLGRASLSMTRVDMTKLAAEVRRAVEHDEPGRAIEWRIGRLPPAWGDAGLLRQALLNLVGNAAKYSRARDPAVIEIDGRELGNEVEYSVRDNGVGFDMAYVGKLFGVFQRLHRAEEFEGTGIGLALAKRIVDRHGGRIDAEGTLDRGATFRFALPARGKEDGVGGP
ncbi:phytochrome sensor signal transduction histidine kinase [Stella humosa]|uniref:histidine kinase n=1 Tax=Stella humosa TaxID=94 RepID=A0A3N1KZP8_9PROT|nr:ATP-binding protein [Stella humosa]ROP83798.1 phytochrome sensor signal transduction histidine kinase [Stella humosa]BBK32941.1 histidine kinase [Stella humosa]